MKISTLLISLCLTLSNVSGQLMTNYISEHPPFASSHSDSNAKYEYNSTVTSFVDLHQKLNDLSSNSIRKHPLGDNIARRIYLIENYYTHISTPSPGELEGQKIVSKPAIYNSVCRLEKYYKKQIKKGIVDSETGINELAHFLDIALILSYENTQELQTDLKKAKDINSVITLFNRIEIYNTITH